MHLRVLSVILPFCIVLFLWRRSIPDVRDRFLVAAILWAGWAFGLTELLSRFNHISSPWVLAGWIVGSIVAAALAPFIPSIPSPP